MAKFRLEIYTPKKQFFSEDVEAVTCTGMDGQITVLANHQPMTVALDPGELKIKNNGEWRTAYNSEGFMEVRGDTVLVFSHLCEWPEDIDEVRAIAAVERDTEQLRNTESLSEHRRNEIELQRMLAMLRVRNRNIK